MSRQARPLFVSSALLAAGLAGPAYAVDFFWSATASTFGWFDRETPNGPPGFSPWTLGGGGLSGEHPDGADDRAFLSTATKTTTLGTSVTIDLVTISGLNAALQMNGGVLTTVSGFTIQTASAELGFTGGTVNNSTGGMTNLGTIRGISGVGTISGDVTTSGQVIVGNASTLNFTGNNTDFTQTAGSFDVIAGGTANFNGSGRSFDLLGGTLNNAGNFNLNTGPIFTLNGGSLVNTGDFRINAGGTFDFISGMVSGEVRMAGGDLNLMVPLTTSPAALGSPVFRFTGNGALTGDIHEAVTIVVENPGGSVTLGVGNTPIENRGEVVLSSDTFGGFSGMSFQSGGGLDNNGGTVRAAFNAGTTTDRRLTGNGAATFINRNGGRLIVEPDMQLTMSMDVVNTADIDVQLNGSVQFGNNVLFEMNGGTLDNSGEVLFSSGSGPSVFRYTGGTITGNAVSFNNGQLELDGGTSPAAFHFTGGTANRHGGDLAPGQLLIIDAINQGTSVANGNSFAGDNSFTNAGTIRLTGADANDIPQYVLTGNQSVLTNTGLIHAEDVPLSSNTRRFSSSNGAQMLNSGQIMVDPDTTLALSIAVVNTGDVTVGINGTLDMDAANANSSFTHNAGSIVNNGRFVFGTGDNFTYIGGTISGNAIELSDAVLTLAPGTGPASFVMHRGQFVGDINAGQTVELRNDLTSNAIIETPAAMANNGVLIHGGGAGAGANVFRIGGLFQNLVLTNNSTYIARNDNAQGLGGNRQLNGELHNFGTAIIEANATFVNAVRTENHSSFTVMQGGAVSTVSGRRFVQVAGTLDNSGSFIVSGGGAFEYNGGTIIGNTITVDAGSLTFGPGAAGGQGAFEVLGFSAFGGAVPEDVTVRFIPNTAGTAVVNIGSAPGEIVNHGLIEMDNSGGGLTDLRTLSSHTITDTGTLRGDGRISFQVFPGTLSNQGLIDPGGFGGDATGLITVAGVFSQEPTGVTHLEIGGTPDTAFDRVVATSAVSLAGTLSLALTNGFTPSLGDSFTLVSGSSRTGMFDAITGAVLLPGLGGAVTYTANAAVLTIARPGDTNLDGDVDNSDLQAAIASFNGPTGSGVTWAGGDSDGDGDVDNSDLQRAIAGFTGPNPAPVPEPGSAVLLALSAGPFLRRRTRRRPPPTPRFG